MKNDRQYPITNSIQNHIFSLHVEKSKYFLSIIVVLIILFSHEAYTQEWTRSDFISANVRQSAVSLGSKVYFAGGSRSNTNYTPSTLIDIYDVTTGGWSYKNLSEARDFPAAVKNGSKLFFAGGFDLTGVPKFFSVVDIYDAQAESWDTAHLTQPRAVVAAVSYGDEVLFAGGLTEWGDGIRSAVAIVDIYNTSTEVWDTASLSEPRWGMAYAVAGTKAIFAGGWNGTGMTNRVDIYDFISRTWSTDSLSMARGFLSATTLGNKVIIAGGMINSNTPTNRVDIYDVGLEGWDPISSMSIARATQSSAVSICGEAFFAGGGNFNVNLSFPWTAAKDVVDIYNPDTKIWRTEHLSHFVVDHAVVANVEADPDINYLLVGGGTDAVSFSFTTVDIYTCFTVSNGDRQYKTDLFTVYPNPAVNTLYIRFETDCNNAVVTITDMTGAVANRTIVEEPREIEIQTRDFTAGVYNVHIQSDQYSSSQKVLIVK